MAQKKSHAGKITLGAGLIAAAAAGAYFLFGTQEGQKTQKKIKGWMLKAKGEVIDKLEDMKDVNEENYAMLVDGVIEKYKKLKKVQESEATILSKDLKKHWKNIKKELSSDPVQSVSKKK